MHRKQLKITYLQQSLISRAGLLDCTTFALRDESRCILSCVFILGYIKFSLISPTRTRAAIYYKNRILTRISVKPWTNQKLVKNFVVKKEVRKFDQIYVGEENIASQNFQRYKSSL